MASFRALHVVCLFSWLLLRAWRTDCQSNSHLPCSEHLGANRLSNLQTPPKGRKNLFSMLQLLGSRCFRTIEKGLSHFAFNRQGTTDMCERDYVLHKANRGQSTSKGCEENKNSHTNKIQCREKLIIVSIRGLKR